MNCFSLFLPFKTISLLLIKKYCNALCGSASVSLGCGLFPLLRGGATCCRGGIPFEREMSQRDKRIAVLQGGRPPLGDGICPNIVRHGLWVIDCDLRVNWCYAPKHCLSAKPFPLLPPNRIKIKCKERQKQSHRA